MIVGVVPPEQGSVAFFVQPPFKYRETHRKLDAEGVTSEH